MARKKRKDPVVVPEVRIEKMAAEGKCLGYLPDERVVFVPFSAPGDVVDIRLGRRRKSYAEGVVERMISPSPHRVEPRCEHFGTCGGCKWQHLPYEMQLQAKEEQVYDQLERIGHLVVEQKNSILGANPIYRYRNKLEFTFTNRRWLTSEEIGRGEDFSDSDAGLQGVGFHIPGRFDRVLDIHACHLQDEVSDQIRLYIKEYCLTHGYSFFDLREQTGLMRTLMIRTSSTGELMVVLVFAYEDEEKRIALLESVRKAFPQITSLMFAINEKRNDSWDQLEVQLFSGRAFIWEKMEGLKFRVGPKSFYQTNSGQAYELYNVVRRMAALTEGELVYDLYTGTGTIASFVAQDARQVIGIEYVEEAVEDARLNATANGQSNLLFYAGDMKDILTPEFLAHHGVPDVLITDPPRAGMHSDVVRVILDAAPQKIVYVSCNPASQARDVALLQEKYRVVESQPVDMFPHTSHVENVLLLQRK